jgi:parallel beta-helix repeat protein
MGARFRGVPTRFGIAVAAALLVVASVGVPAASATSGTLTESTTLDADYYGNILIGADDITLDCAGYTVYGAGEGSGILLDGRSRVTVKNCRVTGFVRGFELSRSSHNRLEHNIATHNLASYGQGFFLTNGSNANVLEENTANENGVLGDPGSGMEGFRVQDSQTNVLHDNVANSNSSWGFIVVGYDADASGNRLEGNTANDNAAFGLVLATRAVGNTLTGNTADGNGNTGFVVNYNAGSNTFQNNRAANNRYNGFSDSDSPNNTFVGNVADHNGATGFAADRTSGLVFSRNTASGSLDGFVILLVDSSRFVMNTADHNGRNGFAALNSASDVFSGNVVKGNGDSGGGFVFLGSSDLWVENNAAEGVLGACFYLGNFELGGPGTSATTLVGNTATRCGSGFGLDVATGNTLKENKATNGNPGGEGFALGPGADSNVLTGNSAIDNSDGFKLWSQGNGGASHNVLTANLANKNAGSGFLVQEDASYNTFVRNFAHANGDWDAIQYDNAGPGNTWVDNHFGTTAGF